MLARGRWLRRFRQGPVMALHTNLILDKPARKLLHGPLAFLLEAANKYHIVGCLHVERAVHGFLLPRMLAPYGLPDRGSGRALGCRIHLICIIADRVHGRLKSPETANWARLIVVGGCRGCSALGEQSRTADVVGSVSCNQGPIEAVSGPDFEAIMDK